METFPVLIPQKLPLSFRSVSSSLVVGLQTVSSVRLSLHKWANDWCLMEGATSLVSMARMHWRCFPLLRPKLRDTTNCSCSIVPGSGSDGMTVTVEEINLNLMRKLPSSPLCWCLVQFSFRVASFTRCRGIPRDRPSRKGGASSVSRTSFNEEGEEVMILLQWTRCAFSGRCRCSGPVAIISCTRIILQIALGISKASSQFVRPFVRSAFSSGKGTDEQKWHPVE